MKRILLAMVFAVAVFGIYSIHQKFSDTKPTPAERIEQVHKDVVPTLQRVPAAEFEQANPAPQVKKNENPNRAHRVRRAPAARHLPQSRPLAPKAPVAHLPPQQGDVVPVRLYCLFPFNLIPSCYVDAS